jgi:hypothetical protein
MFDFDPDTELPIKSEPDPNIIILDPTHRCKGYLVMAPSNSTGTVASTGILKGLNEKRKHLNVGLQILLVYE